MKNITVAVAALAAGLMTFAANAQPRGGDRPMAKVDAAQPKASQCAYILGCGKTTKKAAALQKAKPAHASKAKSDRGPKAAKVAAEGPVRKRGKTASAAATAKAKPRLDMIRTASLASQRKPELVAKARKSVSGDSLPGVWNDGFAIPTTMVAASAAGAVPITRYQTIVSRYAESYGVPASLAHAVITVESNYRVDALGNAGEIGLMQIKPATARMMGYTGSIAGLYDPEENIKFGIKYLAMAHKLSGGATCGTILKYNAGHAARRMNPVSAAYCTKVKRHLAGV